jgi:hypothetical protein
MTESPTAALDPDSVLRIADVGIDALREVLTPRGVVVMLLDAGAAIPGSYHGPPEAGLVGDRLYVRPDTPVHSALHEACHSLCMSAQRRAVLSTDAGGDFDEENAVCYLQILLADAITGMRRDRMMRDMDAWGYSFRLGSARRWFEGEAEDARQWLIARGLIPAG